MHHIEIEVMAGDELTSVKTTDIIQQQAYLVADNHTTELIDSPLQLLLHLIHLSLDRHPLPDGEMQSLTLPIAEKGVIAPTSVISEIIHQRWMEAEQTICTSR